MTLESITVLSWWMIFPLGIVGSLLHFAFDWTGHNRWAAIFSAVNESYWEHIKIAILSSVGFGRGFFYRVSSRTGWGFAAQ